MLWTTCVICPMDGGDVTGGWRNRPGSLKAHAVEPASASRNEANARRDAGSMASRRSVSFPSGNHGYVRNLRRSPSGARAALENAMGTRCPRHQTYKSLPSVDGAQLRQEKKGPRVAKVGGACVPKANSWEVSLDPQEEGRAEDLRLWNSILIHHIA